MCGFLLREFTDSGVKEKRSMSPKDFFSTGLLLGFHVAVRSAEGTLFSGWLFLGNKKNELHFGGSDLPFCLFVRVYPFLDGFKERNHTETPLFEGFQASKRRATHVRLGVDP